jgi:hypothetical protein
MKNQFGARYVRLYGTCDNVGYNDDLVNAAADAKIGVYGLVWFGFDGGDEWVGRMARLVNTIKTNPRVRRFPFDVGKEGLISQTRPGSLRDPQHRRWK